jgi:HEAT repeat protein
VGIASRPELDHAITRLKNAGAPRPAMAVLARMLIEGDSRARQNAAYVFVAIPDPFFGDPLLRAVSDENEIVRERACMAVGSMKLSKAVGALSAATSDPSPVVRREAATALGHIGARAAAPKIVALLDDSIPETRLAAILALGDLHEKSAEARLLPLLKDPSETVRLATAKSLCVLGNAEGKKSVEALLKSPEASERRDGIKLIEDVKAPWISEALLQALRDKDLGVCVAGASALAKQGDGRGVEWLVLSSARVDPEAQLKIETALEELRLSPEDRKKILARKPTAGLPLPPAEATK